jgi:hypothetical protein
MCRRWSTSWPSLPARALLALALLLAPLIAPLVAIGQAAPALTIAICTAGGEAKQVPDPLAPAAPTHVHCEACVVAPPAMPVPSAVLRRPVPFGLAWAAPAARHAAPAALPPEQARAPPAA